MFFYFTVGAHCTQKGPSCCEVTVMTIYLPCWHCILYFLVIIWQCACPVHLKNDFHQVCCCMFVYTNMYTHTLKNKSFLQVVVIMAVRLWLMGGSMPLFSEQDNPASFSPQLLTRSVLYTLDISNLYTFWDLWHTKASKTGIKNLVVWRQ